LRSVELRNDGPNAFAAQCVESGRILLELFASLLGALLLKAPSGLDNGRDPYPGVVSLVRVGPAGRVAETGYLCAARVERGQLHTG